MIAGRPTNQWIGAILGISNLVVLVLAALVPPIIIPAVVVSGFGTTIGLVIALVAGQPPTMNPGDTFNVTTPAGQPNAVTTVATPPAADKPPVIPKEKP